MKYIDAEKLKKAIEDKGLDCSFALKIERLDTLALIDKLRESEDKRRAEELIKALQSGYYEGYQHGKEDTQKEQKSAEWSEEDEEMLNSCISSIEESKENRYAYKENDGDTSYDREIAWLKSLRPQPQGTYKQVIHTIFGMLKDKDFYEIQPSYRVSLLNDIRVKCKDAIVQ